MSCFSDDFAGTVIVNRIMGIERKESADSWYLHVGADENWYFHLVQYTLEKGMPGLENLALIPGCAGSSPIQNIESLRHRTETRLRICRLHRNSGTGTAKRLTAEIQCRFGYRDSIFKHDYQDRFVTGPLACAWRKSLETRSDLRRSDLSRPGYRHTA